MFLGLRTVIYPAPDLAASKAWYTALLGVEPYFDEPFYVGFDVGGYELGLHPETDAAETYWGVEDDRGGARGAARRRRGRAIARDRRRRAASAWRRCSSPAARCWG